MDEQVKAYLAKYPDEVTHVFMQLRSMLFACAPSAPREALWARLPSYTVGASFVRLIPFKDHINIEAAAIPAHRLALPGYMITPKGMLQIFLHQEIPADVLRQIFAETLGG